MSDHAKNDYKNGLFACCSDLKLSCATCFCPCYTQGKNAEALGEDCLIHGLLGMVGVIFGPVIRWRLREQKNIAGTMLKDVLVYTFCHCCASVQDARELGWNLNDDIDQLGLGKQGDKLKAVGNTPDELQQDMTRQ